MDVKITKKNPGKYCTENDFVIGYWKKYNGTDGTKMEDVKEHGDGRAAVFRVGHFEVSKCLDLAAQQMKGGESATITCPHDLDQGGSVQNNYRNSFNGNYWLQDTTPTKYEFEISECSLNPRAFRMEDHLENLTEGYPFYILTHGKRNSDGHQMAIEVDPRDMYAPKVTGVHNVVLKPWDGKEKPNKY